MRIFDSKSAENENNGCESALNSAILLLAIHSVNAGRAVGEQINTNLAF